MTTRHRTVVRNALHASAFSVFICTSSPFFKQIRPGGRLGPPLGVVSGPDSEGGKSELSKASVIVASAFKVSEPSHYHILAVD